ncbi:hypothetical protein [Streptomyces sp. 8L]|uniref:hypothetical protein n=1 Tax=Streptomyces sp. 8L TaxID=2877242 RepID=UPI001CD4D8BB|nr:hypothetical protein [Streptomyces sp. 8L]MCA1221458.1 hypothetical protein [Streptomyces sp. 8L]
MVTHPYVRGLEAAEFIMGSPAIKGIPMWRGRGMDAVRLLVKVFVELVRARHPVDVVEHGFLASQADNRRVFGDYGNVYELLDLPGNPDALFRSDQIVSSLARLDREQSAGPLVAVGPVLRRFAGRTAPLFRDRMVWPVVELNQLAPDGTAEEVLDFYRVVIEELLLTIGIRSFTVCTGELADYGRLTYLVVTALPNRRPTVLATLYVLADGLREALGQEQDIVDVGFTGKVLATTAMVHTDSRGLVLASTVAPVQLGVTVAPATDLDDCRDWFQALEAAGIRYEVVRASASTSSRARAERSWHRRGVPLVVGLGRSPGSVVLCSRLPQTRVPLSGRPAPDTVRAHLDSHDQRLRDSSQRLLTDTTERNGHLRTLCGACAADPGSAVFGHVVPITAGRCDTCGADDGREYFISKEGRFY